MESSILEGWTDKEILSVIKKVFGDGIEVNVGNVIDLFTLATARSVDGWGIYGE